MSGTSADGIDGVLVDFTGDRPVILEECARDYAAGVKEEIESVIARYPDIEHDCLRQLDEALAADFAAAAGALMAAAPRGIAIQAIGSHGQTIYHGPGDTPPVSIQLGHPRRIAALCGLTTVGNFRANDLRAGGQGAPLAPGFHNAVFRSPETGRVIVNIGGIANLTHLPADTARPVTGWDTGPGNTLMDQWCRLHTGRPYDDGGRWAAGGRAHDALLDALLADDYFDQPEPKSTGREHFNLDWMKRRYPPWQSLAPEDVQASLLEVTVRSIAAGAAQAGEQRRCEMYICGGGAANTMLMERLAATVPGSVHTTAALGVAPGQVEPCAFAWLARRRLQGLPGNIPSVTGARRETLLGEVFTPPG